MKNSFLFFTVLIVLLVGTPSFVASQESPAVYPETIFDDKLLLNGFAEKFSSESKDVIVAMIQDDALNPYRMAAAVRVFKNKYCQEVVSPEKRILEKILIRRMNRTDSPFVQVEVMETLCQMDRFKYFTAMVPGLILKLDHYNSTVNDLAYQSINQIIKSGNNRSREARIIFMTLRKILFLSRQRLAKITNPDERLKQKLELVRWAIKVLGTEELKRLPKEVINLL